MIETLRTETGSTGLFFLFLGGFALTALVAGRYPSLFRRDTMQLFYFTGLDSEKRNLKSSGLYRVLCTVIFVFAVSLFFSTVLARIYFDRDFSFDLLLKIFALSIAFVLARQGIDRALSWMLDIRDFGAKWRKKLRALHLFAGVCGLALFFVLTYFPWSGFYFDYNAGFWIFLFYIVLSFAVAVEYLAPKPLSLFYFIFYLCIVEICPIIILWSLFRQPFV